MAQPRAQLRRMHACEATDREKEEWRSTGAAEKTGKAVSKPVRNSEREQRGCTEAVASLFSAPAFARLFRLAIVRAPLWRAEFLFSLKGAAKKYTVAI